PANISTTFVVSKAQPAKIDVSATQIFVGQTLADSNLTCIFNGVDGNALAGTITWDDASKRVTNAGTAQYSATFIPTDSDNYSEVKVEVSLTAEQLVVTYVDYYDQTVSTVAVDYNGSVDPTDIPAVPSRDGYVGSWEFVPANVTAQGTVVSPVYQIQAPVVAFAGEIDYIYGDAINLTGSNTKQYADDANVQFAYNWTLDDVSVGNEAVLNYTNASVGNYTFVLTITVADKDGKNASASAQISISVAQATITSAQFVQSDFIYDATQKTVTVSSITANGKPWADPALGTDYTISGTVGTIAKGYTLTITGEGNFSGTITADWTIARKEITITAEGSGVYTGNVHTVKDWSVTPQGLVEGHVISLSATTDGVDVKYSGETIDSYKYASGDANSDFTGLSLSIVDDGQNNVLSNYIVTLSLSYTINPATISVVEIEENSFTYDSEQKSVTITSITANGKNWADLVVDTDYTVSGNNGTTAGDYTLTIAGKGNFAGTASADWSIAKATYDLSQVV
ncbi:MAG: hypothetical protein IJV77_07500, partial [Clostridia bacterium]|nr:hypothetical protein [Clostridia bacterium]